eukprot:m.719982 g.719982  ORF g.719982 m.719982 type:complete len:133 (-) comp58816_c1_seq1:245-643(-)
MTETDDESGSSVSLRNNAAITLGRVAGASPAAFAPLLGRCMNRWIGLMKQGTDSEYRISLVSMCFALPRNVSAVLPDLVDFLSLFVSIPVSPDLRMALDSVVSSLLPIVDLGALVPAALSGAILAKYGYRLP